VSNFQNKHCSTAASPCYGNCDGSTPNFLQ